MQDEFVRRMAAIDEEVEGLEDDEIQDDSRTSMDPEESLAAEIQELGREVVDHEDRTMGERSSSEDADGLVQDIPGAARVRQGLYEMSGALPVE
ncbi:MAG: hypothetical protein L6R42_011010 [Xanthoria sp. 1 TBL-2021]|nr:MAG: hypothetical protein L6R42_011010 [Xanthoria sp. 1 TBL-2021]